MRGLNDRMVLYMQFASIAALAAAVTAQLAFAEAPLPMKTDIPADYGGAVICSSADTSLAFLRNHHVVNAYGGLDTDKYLLGRKVTGCTDTDQQLQIVEILERRSVGTDADGPYIAFRARTPSGSIVTGVVGEGGNNRHPRTPTERWLRLHAPNGSLQIAKGSAATYSCPSMAAAHAVVSAIPPVKARGAANPNQVAAFRTALKRNRCATVSGLFRIHDVGPSAFISLGYEAGQQWTVLSATDAQSRSIFLLYDASVD